MTKKEITILNRMFRIGDERFSEKSFLTKEKRKYFMTNGYYGFFTEINFDFETSPLETGFYTENMYDDVMERNAKYFTIDINDLTSFIKDIKEENKNRNKNEKIFHHYRVGDSEKYAYFDAKFLKDCMEFTKCNTIRIYGKHGMAILEGDYSTAIIFPCRMNNYEKRWEQNVQMYTHTKNNIALEIES